MKHVFTLTAVCDICLHLQMDPAKTCILYESKELVTCLSHDHADPFIVVMATLTHLMLVDVRDPGRPTLSVQLNLLKPPTCVTVDNTTGESELVCVHCILCKIWVLYQRVKWISCTYLLHTV